MAVDLRKVKKLIELVEESGIAELEVSSGDESVRISRYATGVPADALAGPVVSSAPDVPVTAPVPDNQPQAAAVKAPMAGTFYQAAHPEAAPFVQVGHTVQAGDVLCIIESMKMMHEIRAETSGEITRICVENAQPINTGDELFKLS